MTQQTGKVALITGASRGIGALLAERLAGDGFTVVVNYAGSAKAAEDVVRKIKAAGGNALTSQADVSNPTAVVRMFDSAEATFGGLDAVASREVRGRNITVNAIAPIVNGVADRVRREMYRNIGLEDLLTPRVVAR